MTDAAAPEGERLNWKRNICIIAAEASGDANAAALVQSMRQLSVEPLEFWGIAGPKMRAVGVADFSRAEELSVMGFAEVLVHYLRLRSIHKRIEAEIARRKPDLVILVDAPAFNLRIAQSAFEVGSVVHYHIPPKVWAHGENRSEVLRDHCQLVTCVLPFEESFLRERGVRAHYVGHPLKDQVDGFRKQHSSFLSTPTVRSTARNIGLLPGSRVAEVKAHLPVLVEAFARLRLSIGNRSRELAADAQPRSFPGANDADLPMLVGTIPIAETLDEVWVLKELRRLMAVHQVPEGCLRAVRGSMYSVLSKADYAWVCSGTAVLEACFFAVPHAVFYRTSALSYAIASRIVKVDFIGLVNLIAGREVCPEFIQNECTATNLHEHALRLLGSPERLGAVRNELQTISESFPPRSGERAARRLFATMEYWAEIPRELRQRMLRRGLGPM